MIRYINLFAGAGGWEIAAKELGWLLIANCEIEKYCQKLLKKRFGNAHETHADANDMPFERYRGAVHVVTMSPPCQPFSTAGNHLGAADNRNLLPLCVRAVDQIRPIVALLENVRGLLDVSNRLVLRQYVHDLESRGYRTAIVQVSSGSVGALHLRERVVLVSHADQKRPETSIVSTLTREAKEAPRKSILDFPTYAGRVKAAREPNFLGMVNGLPTGLDKLRGTRIGLMGNAFDPRVAYRILRSVQAGLLAVI